MPRDEGTYRAFAEWWAMPAGQRAALDLPETQKGWAAERQVTPKTLRRWRERDDFEELVAKAEERFRRPSPDVPDEVLAELSEDERQYLEIKKSLVKDAKDGDRSAREQYFKTYGKAFVEAELAARDSSWADLSFDELVEETLSLLGPETVSAWLQEQEVGR